MFVVDFDNTLFDTHWFKQERLGALRSLGVTDELYWQTYQMARNDEGGHVTYTDERHAAAFAGTDIDRRAVLNALTHITTSRIKEFLFPNAVKFLSKLASFDKPIVLLNLGAPSFQQTKVSGTGVDQYVDEVLTIDSINERVLKHRLSRVDPKEVWFINDNIDETQRLKDQFPEMTAILKQLPLVPDEAYTKTGLPYFDSLTDIASYVKDNHR